MSVLLAAECSSAKRGAWDPNQSIHLLNESREKHHPACTRSRVCHFTFGFLSLAPPEWKNLCENQTELLLPCCASHACQESGKIWTVPPLFLCQNTTPFLHLGVQARRGKFLLRKARGWQSGRTTVMDRAEHLQVTESPCGHCTGALAFVPFLPNGYYLPILQMEK